jgi:hypothetical protein
MKKWRSIRVAVVALLLCLLGGANSLAADPPQAEDDWEFSLALYLWGASINGREASGSEIDAGFSDILNDLELAFMGMAQARKGRWAFTADVIYLDVEGSEEIAPGVDIDLDLSNWVITPFASYRLAQTEHIDFNILAGARYLYLKAELGIDAVGLREEESGSNWDAIVGINGAARLTDKWYLPYHLDIGTGESDLTFQAYGGIGYRFKWFDVVAAYRYLRWDLDGKVVDNMYIHGPEVGIRFRF